MMRRPTIFVLVLAMLAFFPAWQSDSCALGIRHGQKDVKHEIEDLEQQWRSAQISGDTGTMDRLLSDDYVGIGMNGMVTTKTQQLDRIRRRTMVLTRIDISDVKVKLVGTVAIVTSMAQIEGSQDGTTMSGNYRYTRVYQRLPSGTWKITNFEATRISQAGSRSSTIDGPNAGPARSRLISETGPERH